MQQVRQEPLAQWGLKGLKVTPVLPEALALRALKGHKASRASPAQLGRPAPSARPGPRVPLVQPARAAPSRPSCLPRTRRAAPSIYPSTASAFRLRTPGSWGDGFTTPGNDQFFNVGSAGTYLISYNVRTTLAVASGTCVSNSSSNALGCIPALAQNSSVPQDQYQGQAIVTLPANTQLNLRLIGTGTAILQGGVGASLTVVRLK